MQTNSYDAWMRRPLSSAVCPTQDIWPAVTRLDRVAGIAHPLHGAYGYSSEYPVERLLRDAKLYQLLEGSANICKMVIATDALGYRKANR